MLWPALLGSSRLDGIIHGGVSGVRGGASAATGMESILSANYQPAKVTREDTSGRLLANPTVRQASQARQAANQRVLAAVELSATLAGGSWRGVPVGDNVRSMAESTLAGLLREALSQEGHSIPTRELAAAMGPVTPGMIDGGLLGGLEAACPSRGLALARMVGYRRGPVGGPAGGQGDSLLESFRGLTPAQMVEMARFAFGPGSRR